MKVAYLSTVIHAIERERLNDTQLLLLTDLVNVQAPRGYYQVTFYHKYLPKRD